MKEESNLIHFTAFCTKYKKKSKDYEDRRNKIGFNHLLGIIENGFRFNRGATFTPRDPDGKLGIILHIGMICFAEVSKNYFFDNIDKFGKFGICMKKEWIQKFSGQPVLYTFPNSVNNKILYDLNNLIGTTHNLFLETNDIRTKQISLSIADISNHFQAITEIIDYKYENEWRIINDPQNEVLENAICPRQKIKFINNCEIYSSDLYLPISDGDDAEFYIIPSDYKDLFCSKVVNPDNNRKKIVTLEEFK